jgi:hypothetical protein
LDRWQFEELEIFPHLQTTVTERLGDDGKELRKMLSAMERATKSYMADCGHGPDDLNVQMLSGFRYTDLHRTSSSDLMNFIFPREPGTSLLALGSYGAANGKTLTSYTGRVIERALAGAASFGLLFLDILNISVDVVENFKGTNGNRMFKSKKCMKHPSFRTLQDTIQKVTAEVCRLRLKLNKQASIVLLRLGPSIQAVWDAMIKYCENQFQGGNEDNTYRVIIHDTMSFHPSALYTHFGKDDGSYRREQLLNFFEDMNFLAAKLGCRDDMTSAADSNFPSFPAISMNAAPGMQTTKIMCGNYS